MNDLRSTVLRWTGAACLALLSSAATAGTVVPMNVDRMSDLSGQVIVGRVAAVRSYFAENPRRIESEVIFEGVEYFKGAAAGTGNTFRLIVPGGTVGTMQMRIACAPEFSAGERWVLFLLPTYKTFPVVGLHQGAFRVRPAEHGVERVYDAGNRPVTGFDAEGFAVTPTEQPPSPEGRVAAADRVRIHAIAAPETATAMTLAEFLARLRPTLDASRDHHLTEPAGKPEPVRLTSAPLRFANGGELPAGNRTTRSEARLNAAPEAKTGGGRRAERNTPEGGR